MKVRRIVAYALATSDWYFDLADRRFVEQVFSLFGTGALPGERGACDCHHEDGCGVWKDYLKFHGRSS